MLGSEVMIVLLVIVKLCTTAGRLNIPPTQTNSLCHRHPLDDVKQNKAVCSQCGQNQQGIKNIGELLLVLVSHLTFF